MYGASDTMICRMNWKEGYRFREPGYEVMIKYWAKWTAEMEETDLRFMKKEESTRFGN